MDRNTILEHIRDVLTRAGFYVSDIFSIRATSLDLVARRDDTLLLIKALANIDSLTEPVAQELQTLASLLKATPLLIGEKNGLNSLEDEVVYFRCGIQTITLLTLQNHLLDGIPISVYAAPGGLYVNLDTQQLKESRKQKNISLGAFARYVRISRRMVQMYEDGTNARVDVASRIEELLESSIIQPINLMQHQHIIKQTKLPLTKTDLDCIQQEVFSLLQKVGYQITPVGKCPFEAVSTEKRHIILTSVQQYGTKLPMRARIIKSISKITEKHGVVITDKESSKKTVEGTPLIAKKELKKICDPEDVIAIILEREYNS